MSDEFTLIWLDEAVFSQATFGTDSVRGPLGPLKHLARETQEAIDKPYDITEYADCLLLIMDASRRAGFGCAELLAATRTKLNINRLRKWPKSSPDEPVLHVKD